MQDAWRAYLELALGVTEASRKKAQKVARNLVGKSGATASQLSAMAEELLSTSAANREALTKLIRFEIDKALGRVGLATAEEVADLTTRVRDLEGRLREAQARAEAAEAAASEPAPTPTPATKAVATRVPAKKAVAKQAKAVEPAPAPAKKVAAKKTAKKTTAKKAAPPAAGIADEVNAAAPVAEPAPAPNPAKKAPTKASAPRKAAKKAPGGKADPA